ncbi:MAG: BrnA antitoxin family protein [Polyangiales bacterium]
MKANYDFKRARKNPYAKRLKKQVTIRLEQETVDYFKRLADDCAIPYQTLINLYLRECAATARRLTIAWQTEPRPRNAESAK